MATVMKASEFVEKLNDVVKNYKTLYVMGCFGAPMTAKNKTRYCSNHEYNKKSNRTAMIQAASTDTFGFDCVCLIKGILWGWSGDKTKTYGGAKYGTKGVPDVSADGMIQRCSDVTTNFTNINIGEALWCKGHIGVYIGDGLAIECTPAWKNCVQITAVRNIGTKSGYNARTWTKHGKLPYIEYDVKEAKPALTEKYTLVEFIRDIQEACGASVDGIAGPETLSKTVTLSAVLNRKHTTVYYVQRRLQALGYAEVGKVDGIAGSKFTTAVKHFQKDNGCEVDGEITARNKTWKKLLGME
jgi:hypothetical protein